METDIYDWEEKITRATEMQAEAYQAIMEFEQAIETAPVTFAEWLYKNKNDEEQSKIFALLRIRDRRFRKGGPSDRVFSALDDIRRRGLWHPAQQQRN